MPMMCDRCHNAADTPLVYDERYSDWLCSYCFDTRKRDALNARDTDWFMINNVTDGLSEQERFDIGL